MVSTAAFHARVRASVPGLGGLKETKMFLPHPRVKVSIVESLRDREVACSASDRQGSNFESCVWRTVSSQSSHHPQEVLLAQFSLYVHKGGLKPDSFISFCTDPELLTYHIHLLHWHIPCKLLNIYVRYINIFQTIYFPFHSFLWRLHRCLSLMFCIGHSHNAVSMLFQLTQHWSSIGCTPSVVWRCSAPTML